MKKICFLLGALMAVTSVFSQEYLKLMTYNVRNANGLDGVRSYQRIADVIRNATPDVVAVQELDSMTQRSSNKYVLGEIAERAQMHAVYHPAIDFNGGKYGIGILSRQKPLSVKGISLPGREEQRALLVAEFDEYVFACTHLSLTEEDRLASLELIKQQASQSKKPFYVAGDMNDTPESAFVKGLQQDFTLLNDVKAHTFPANKPDRTIDYIAVWKSTAPKYAVASKEVLEEPVASDHAPVAVNLRTALAPEKFFRTKPYLQNPTDGGMTVMWETVIPAYSWVEYGTDTTNLQRVRLILDGQAEFNESIHKIRLDNLQSGQKYYYRVCSQEILRYEAYHKIFGNTAKSPFYSFVAPKADADSFTAIIFNDLHQRQNVFEALCKQIEGVNYDFVVFNGDCIDDPKGHDQATFFVKLLTEAVRGDRIPTLFLRGNHEIRNVYSIGLRKHFDYVGGRTFGAFNWGDTRIVMLDCGEDKTDDHKEYSGLNDFTHLRLEQVDFLKQELASKAFKKADKRILFHHIPIYGMLGENLCEKLWRPYLDKAPFNLSIHAHTHRFAYHPVGDSENRYPVIIGGGNNLKNATVMILEKTKGQLKVKVLDATGKVLLDFVE